MADINQQTEELARIMEQVNREMAAYGQITKATGDQKRDAEIEAATGMKNFTKASDKAADGVGYLAGAAMSAGQSMLEGKKGAAAFNDSIDGITSAVKALGVALTLLVPGGILIKGVIAGFTALAAATADQVKKSNEMADKLYKGYSGLASSGAAASDGMSGVFKDAKKLGLSMDQLDSMVTLVSQNSKDLALFGGSVFEGRKQFADMGKAMEPYRESLIKSGLTQEQINEGAMGYLKLQSRIGQSQNKTTAELAAGAKKYLDEQDALTKLTGMTRKEQEDAREEIRSQERFAAVLMEMRAKGQDKEAKELEDAYLILKSQSKQAAQGFADVSTGMINTEAAQKSYMATQGESMKTAERLKSGEIKAAEGAQQVAAAHGRTADAMGASMGKMGVYNDTFGDLAADLRLKGMSANDIEEQLKKVKQEQIDQGLKGGKAADGMTDQYAKNIVQQQKLNEKMENVVFKGIDNALVITNKLGNATDVVATGFEMLGKVINKFLNILGLGVKEPKVPTAPTKEQETASAGVTKARSEADQADKKLADQMAATDALKKSLETIAKTNDKSAETTAKIADIKKQIAASEQQELVLNKEAKLASAKKLEASAAQANANRAARGQASTATATPAPAAKAGTAPAGGGAAAPAGGGGAAGGSAAPSGSAPAKAPPVRLTPQQMEGEAGKESTVKPEDVLTFTARSGSQQAFEGLDGNFKKAVLAAAEQYKAATGKPIQINSAKRDPADQERLYEETVKLGTPGVGPTGMAVAKPGRSLHERGHAVDIQQYKDSAAIAAFNAQGLFQKVAGDPVHFQAREGGVFSGPDSGYDNITLHGTEAVIPLKDGAVPVRLFGNETASTETQEKIPDFDKLFSNITGDPETHTKMPDFGSMINSLSSTMFAAVQTLQPESISSKFDRELRQEVVEPEEATNDTATEVFDTPMANESTGIMEFIKEAKEANFAMLAMISELVREQRNANDISTRILQVSSN
jgi:hypothetical protein